MARIEGPEGSDFLGFGRQVLIGALDYEHAKPYLKPEVDAEEWAGIGETSDDAHRAAAIDYLDFAWGKCADHRGISAQRSVIKLTQWAWLLGLDELVDQMKHGPYAQYGAPALKAFAEALGVPVPDDDPGLTRMMQGLPCSDSCQDGCGR